jgi:serine/threonine protein kinase
VGGVGDDSDDKRIGGLSGKLKTFKLNVEKDEFRSVEMKDYSKLLIVLYVLKELGFVHRDIRPANVLRDRSCGKLTLIDFAFCCDEDEENYFAGGVSCASDYVLENLIRNPSKEFKMCWRDDLNSWVRCWMLISNEEVAERHRHVQRSDNLKLIALEFARFWNDVDFFPFFERGIDAVLGVEDVWELTRKVPSLISFISYFKSKIRNSKNYKKQVGLDIFKNMFEIVLKALVNYLISDNSLNCKNFKSFLRYFDPSSLIEELETTEKIYKTISKIKDAIDENQRNEIKKLIIALNNLKIAKSK